MNHLGVVIYDDLSPEHFYSTRAKALLVSLCHSLELSCSWLLLQAASTCHDLLKEMCPGSPLSSRSLGKSVHIPHEAFLQRHSTPVCTSHSNFGINKSSDSGRWNINVNDESPWTALVKGSTNIASNGTVDYRLQA